MKQLFPAAALAALLAAAPSLAADPMSAKDFITNAQQGNMAEIELGRMAESQAQSQDVRGFAKSMVNDHGKAQEQLASIAQKENLSVTGKLNETNQKQADRLKPMKGAQFDQAYIADMVTNHQKDVQAYQQAQASITDPTLKTYIEQTLPVLQNHLQMAQKLHQPEAAAADKSGQTKQQQR